MKFLLCILTTLCLISCGQKASNSGDIELVNNNTCTSNSHDLALFNNHNWMDGKARQGNGLMFEKLSDKNFEKVTYIRIESEENNRKVVGKKRVNENLKIVLVSGDEFKNLDFQSACLIF